MESLLTNLANELLVQTSPNRAPSSPSYPITISKPTRIASSNISRRSFRSAAAKNSEWSNGKLVIDANHGPTHLLEAAFYVVRLEVQRTGGAAIAR